MRKIKPALYGVDARDLRQVWIAYEPVWAIGQGSMPADPDYAESMHRAIRSTLLTLYGPIASDVPLLYGGSVDHSNAGSYLARSAVDGLFVGRAALEVEDLLAFVPLLK